MITRAESAETDEALDRMESTNPKLVLEGLQMTLLEPEALKISTDRDLTMNSIAISLKRIADALEGTPSKPGLVETFGNTLENSLHTMIRHWMDVR